MIQNTLVDLQYLVGDLFPDDFPWHFKWTEQFKQIDESRMLEPDYEHWLVT